MNHEEFRMFAEEKGRALAKELRDAAKGKFAGVTIKLNWVDDGASASADEVVLPLPKR